MSQVDKQQAAARAAALAIKAAKKETAETASANPLRGSAATDQCTSFSSLGFQLQQVAGGSPFNL